MIIAVLAAAALIGSPAPLETQSAKQVSAPETVQFGVPDLADMACVVVAMEMTGSSSEEDKVALATSTSYYIGKIVGRGQLRRWGEVLGDYRRKLTAEERAQLVEEHGVRCAMESLAPSLSVMQMVMQDVVADISADQD
ncbi:hypothetical protein [Brevundimonas sp.]|uniref:hypothetical protein n=1 Tax=Brevundimonas sp. TaxID=1871086 RepID=UPI0025BFA4EF|nr:hypothetical protein [Brevundimonas sp.]